MAIRFLSSETIDGALTVNSTVTLNKTDNVISIPSLVDNGKFLSVTQVGNETWDFKCESLSGSLDGVTIGTTPGKVAFDENGQIQSIQLLDVATAGGRLTGFSNRGYLSSIHLEQTATNTDGGYIRFLTAASGTTSGLERFKITETGAFSVGPSGTNYGTSGQVLTSQGNALPTWTTPTTGDVTGSGAANYVTYWTGTKAVSGTANFQYDGAINVALGSAPTAFGSGVPNILFKGTDSNNGRAGAIWFKENDGTDTAALYVTDGGDGYGTVLTAYQGDLKLATGSLTGTKMTIQNAGDVLMGNTVVNPATGFSDQRGFGYDNSTGNLQIASTSGQAFIVGRNEASDGTIIELRKESNVVGTLGSNTTSGQMLLDISGSSSNGNIRFVTNGGEVMRMTSAYMVGIGTTDPLFGLSMAQGTGDVNRIGWNDGGGDKRASIICSSSTDALQFHTGTSDTERMRIDSSGNVTIGNATYGSSLGQLRIINDAASSPASLSLFGYNNVADNTDFAIIEFAMQSSGTGGNVLASIKGQSDGTSENAADLRFGTANSTTGLTEKMRITSAGSVGIGTALPDHTLVVQASANINANILAIKDSDGTRQMTVEQDSSGNGRLFVWNTSDANKVLLHTNGNSYFNGGNVGIGTTNPQNKFVVANGTDNNQNLEIAPNYIQSFNRQSGNLGYAPMGFYASSYAFNSGNVGIGTTSPTNMLSIKGSSGSSKGLDIFHSNGNKVAELIHNGSGDEGMLRLLDSNVETVRIAGENGITSFINSGRVGIGTTSPGRMLGVNGGSTQDGGIQLETTATASNYWAGIEMKTPNATSFIYMSSGDTAGTIKFVPAGSIKASLNATSFICAGDVVAYGSPSDITLKKNIKPLENSLDKIKNLQGVSFTWKKPGLSNIVDDIGFIAQDVKEVVPKLVRENEDGKLSMRHQGVIPILVEAIKEQQKQIDRLEEQIKKMSSKN